MEHILLVVQINEIQMCAYTGISMILNARWSPYRNFKYSKLIEFSNYWFSFNCISYFITTETCDFKLLLYLKHSTEFSNILLALYSLTIVCIYRINQSLVFQHRVGNFIRSREKLRNLIWTGYLKWNTCQITIIRSIGQNKYHQSAFN